MRVLVVEDDRKIAGFIEWMQKSGWRQEAVLELEQLAVDPRHQGRGLGRLLIERSLPLVANQLAQRGAKIKHVMVTTRADNFARRLYSSTLNARVEATLENLYSADEVIMIARDPSIGREIKPSE